MHRVHDTPTISIKHDKQQMISLGKVPDVLVFSGVQNSSLYTDKLAIRKALGEITEEEIKNNPDWDLHNHKITWKILEDLADLIADPVAVYEDRGDFIVVIDRIAKDYKGIDSLVMVTVRPNKNSERYAVIPTLYGRSNLIEKIQDACDEGRLKYLDEKKSALSKTARESQYPVIKHTNSIPSREDIVN
ncbi:MAG: hypothetical protein K5838_08955 [Elusimicrobiales bacterium]|nr:hypothetical protein [Elusimicrobiales bacterium]